ncbi:hypothetical protein V1264_015239 [Littorina saxatilis]|uniref:Uncharacterized protein n=2 Tax=Littorina saxatilis TaxID=31220 RepID=A0AAN9BKT9_9CAEN
MTPASKKKRLMTLLGGTDNKEKLMVDMPGLGRSRTSSLDSKRSSVSESSRTPYATSHFPAVREYDDMGYLEPRPHGLPTYLQLLNHAPELELPAFQNARKGVNGVEVPNRNVAGAQSQHASAFRAVGPYSRASMGATASGGKCPLPSTVVYSAVTSASQQPTSPVSFTSNCSDGRRARGSSSSSQTYGVVSVQDPHCCNGNVQEERLIVDLTDLSRIKAAQRKFSDQDLYSSPAQFNQRSGGGGDRGGGRRLSSTSSTMSDHPYSRVIDSANNNNNYSFASNSSARTTPVQRDRHNSGQDLNTSYCSSRGKPPPMWNHRSASESDSVFEEEFRVPPPPYVNVQNGSRSRGQVYPENDVLAGFDIAQASLV